MRLVSGTQVLQEVRTRMTKQSLDGLDKRLLAALRNDGQTSVATLAETVGVTGPTVRSRIRTLIHSGFLRIAGLVNPFNVKNITVAMVGLTLQSHKQLDEKLEQISRLERVHWVAVVTGRYDIIAEVVLTNGMNELYEFLDQDLSQIGGVLSSESFVVMKSKKKWVLLPEKITQAFSSAE